METQYSVNIGECDESHCSTCGLCDKGALYEKASTQPASGAMNVVLVNFGIKKTICSLVDGNTAENIGTVAFLNNDEDDLIAKLDDVVNRLTAGKTFGLVVAAGEQSRLEKLQGQREICGKGLVVMNHIA